MKKYQKAEIIAKNLPTGSYAAGCPSVDSNTESRCQSYVFPEPSKYKVPRESIIFAAKQLGREIPAEEQNHAESEDNICSNTKSAKMNYKDIKNAIIFFSYTSLDEEQNAYMDIIANRIAYSVSENNGTPSPIEPYLVDSYIKDAENGCYEEFENMDDYDSLDEFMEAYGQSRKEILEEDLNSEKYDDGFSQNGEYVVTIYVGNEKIGEKVITPSSGPTKKKDYILWFKFKYDEQVLFTELPTQEQVSSFEDYLDGVELTDDMFTDGVLNEDGMQALLDAEHCSLIRGDLASKYSSFPAQILCARLIPNPNGIDNWEEDSYEQWENGIDVDLDEIESERDDIDDSQYAAHLIYHMHEIHNMFAIQLVDEDDFDPSLIMIREGHENGADFNVYYDGQLLRFLGIGRSDDEYDYPEDCEIVNYDMK